MTTVQREIYAKNEVNPLSRFDTIPAYDRQTDAGKHSCLNYDEI